MPARPVLIVSWLLLAVAVSAQAQQSFVRQRAVPVVRMVPVIGTPAPAAPVALAGAGLPRAQGAPMQLSRLSLDADLDHRMPPPAWDRQDAAYAIWRTALNAVDDGDWRTASQNFHKIHDSYPRSTYAPESWYWEAFSLYRLGGYTNLRRAVAHLDQQQVLYPRTPTAADGQVLATRLRGELAKSGDQDAKRELANLLESGNECSRSVNVRIAALSAYRQIDPWMTVNYLRELFERPAPCTNYLRQQAVFILAQVESPEAADILLNLARSNKDPDVRVEAVQWLADLRDDRSIPVLRDILFGQSSDRQLKETALFSLSQLAGAGEAGIFQAIAASRGMATQLRTQAVLWLAEQRMQVHSDWLLALYRNDRSPAIREAVVSAIAGQQNLADRGWLFSVGRDSTATLALRKQAISAAADLLAPPAELYTLYHQVELLPLREQIIELLGRNHDKSAVERLIDIALLDADSTLRTTSVKWLRQSKDPKAVEFLIAYRER